MTHFNIEQITEQHDHIYVEVGRRFNVVIVLTPGREWVTLIDRTTLETTRLEINAWTKLQPLEAAGLNRRKVYAAMRRRLKYVTAAQTIKQAMRLLRGTAA